MARSSADWQRFETGLKQKIGNYADDPRLTWATAYILAQGDKLISSSEKLSQSFQSMMENKLSQLGYFYKFPQCWASRYY